MWAAVREGGVLVVEDADFEGSFCDPPNQGFAFWVEAYQRVLERRGGDPLLGRKLHRYFCEAGVRAPEVSVVQTVVLAGEAKWLPHSTIEATADAIIQEGLACAEQLETVWASLNDFAGDSTSLSGSPRVFQAWSRRSEDWSRAADRREQNGAKTAPRNGWHSHLWDCFEHQWPRGGRCRQE